MRPAPQPVSAMSRKACTVRVEAKGYGTCEPWFFDYLHCVDHCVSVLDAVDL